jgi:hypothetical protein
MKIFSVFALALITGCAHPYTLDPLSEKPEYLNGIALSNVSTSNCVFQAGYQYSNPLEILVKVRITNKGKAPFEVKPTAFEMAGSSETLPSSPLVAENPENYVRDLKASADLLDSQTKMDSYQGVEELGALKGEEDDKAIDDAKEAYARKQREAEKARKKAEGIRERVAVIEPAALRTTTVKSGETAEGALIFKAPFGETGVVTIESNTPQCAAKIQFMLKK